MEGPKLGEKGSVSSAGERQSIGPSDEEGTAGMDLCLYHERVRKKKFLNTSDFEQAKLWK